MSIWAGFMPRPTTAGVIPAILIIARGFVKELSIFVDESGDFGKYNENAPFYIVSFVFHEQNNPIQNQINILNNSLEELGLKNHTIHTAPLIRREKNYKTFDISIRRKIFHKLFCFTKHVNISHASLIVEKSPNTNSMDITKQLSKQLKFLINEHLEYFTQFDNIIIYYDNGQYQITNILVAIFNTLFSIECEFRQVLPANYKLFQTTDLICTLTLIKSKLEQGKKLTNSEQMFFGSVGKLRKTYLKYFEKIQLVQRIKSKTFIHN